MALGGRLFGRKRERAQEGEGKDQTTTSSADPPSPPSSPPRAARRSKIMSVFNRDREHKSHSASPPPPSLPPSASYTSAHSAATPKQLVAKAQNDEADKLRATDNFDEKPREKEAQRAEEEEQRRAKEQRIEMSVPDSLEGAETAAALSNSAPASPSPRPLSETPPYLPLTPPKTPTNRPQTEDRPRLPCPPFPQLLSSFPPPSSPNLPAPLPDLSLLHPTSSHTPSVYTPLSTLPSLAYVWARGSVLSEDPMRTIWRLLWEGKELIVKGGEGVKVEEAEWTRMVRERTGSALIPQIYGVRLEGDEVFIFMEALPGRPLSQNYHLNFNSRNASAHPLVDQLSRFFRLLHSLPPPPNALPGGFGGKNLLAVSLSVAADSPPSLSSALDLVGWMEDRYRLRNGDMGVWHREIAPELSSSSLICCHGDLAPRNILVEENTLTGVVDFGVAGWYPPWVEDYGALGEWVEEDSSEGLIRFALRGAAARREGLVKLRQIILL